MSNFLSDLYHRFISQKLDQTFEDALDKKEPVIATGASQAEIDQSYNNFGGGNTSTNYISFRNIFSDKRSRISFYRDMSSFSEINDSLAYIADEAITTNERGNVAEISFDDMVPKNVQKRIRRELDYLMNDVFKAEDNMWDMFRKWLIEGELYLEPILFNNGKSIKDIKVLPAYTMTPVYKGNEIEKYNQYITSTDSLKTGMENTSNLGYSGNTPDAEFKPNQVLYVAYSYGKNILDVRSYLDAAIRPYNQLKNTEDALVVYRLTRATERRIFNIAIGRMTKGKAEEYIKNLILKYKKRIGYNSETGAVENTAAIQALTEDFWFPKTEDGKGSEVTTLQSGMNLGKIEDVEYFLKKLYKTLQLPQSRQEGTQYTSTTELTKDEQKFNNFIRRLQNKFRKVITEALILQLKLRGFEERWIDKKLFVIHMSTTNHVQKDKELEFRGKQIEMIRQVADYIRSEEKPDGLFDKDFALKNIVGFTDEDIALNEKMIERSDINKKANSGITPEKTTADNTSEIDTPPKSDNAETSPEESAARDRTGEINPDTGKVIGQEESVSIKGNILNEELSGKYTAKKSLKDKLANIEKFKRNFEISKID